MRKQFNGLSALAGSVFEAGPVLGAPVCVHRPPGRSGEGRMVERSRCLLVLEASREGQVCLARNFGRQGDG